MKSVTVIACHTECTLHNSIRMKRINFAVVDESKRKIEFFFVHACSLCATKFTEFSWPARHFPLIFLGTCSSRKSVKIKREINEISHSISKCMRGKAAQRRQCIKIARVASYEGYTCNVGNLWAFERNGCANEIRSWARRESSAAKVKCSSTDTYNLTTLKKHQ